MQVLKKVAQSSGVSNCGWSAAGNYVVATIFIILFFLPGIYKWCSIAGSKPLPPVPASLGWYFIV